MTKEEFPPTKFCARESKLMFGQTREDALVDLRLMNEITEPRHALVIASGGCTAFSLLSRTNCDVSALDISRSQIALVELKRSIFQTLGFMVGRQALMADGQDAFHSVKDYLTDLDRVGLAPIEKYFKHGLNNCGTVDRKLDWLRKIFFVVFHSRALTEKFLSMTDPAQEKDFYDESWNNLPWRLAIRIAFDRRFLQMFNGFKGGQLVPDHFAKAMANRLRRCMTSFPNHTNPYLWQTFLGEYPSEESGLPPYLQQESAESLITNLKKLRLHCADLIEWLKQQEANSIDYFGLSNVLELMPAAYAENLLPELIRCASSVAIICVRRIFPNLAGRTFASTDERIMLDQNLIEIAHEMDRSPFCNLYEIYRCA